MTRYTKPCDYCGRTDWGCENEAQVVACVPTPANKPTPRQRLAEAIQAAEDKPHGVWRPLPVSLAIEDARAILATLQEADRRELQATLEGDMPCG